MSIRKQLIKTIIKRIESDKADKSSIQRQLECRSNAMLCDMAEGEYSITENMLSINCGQHSQCVVLWRTEYVPQAITKRQEQYNAAPMIMSDLPAYNCPITGRLISSRSQHRENLKRHGCEVAEPSTPRSTWREDKAEDHNRKKAVYDAMQQMNYH